MKRLFTFMGIAGISYMLSMAHAIEGPCLDGGGVDCPENQVEANTQNPSPAPTASWHIQTPTGIYHCDPSDMENCVSDGSDGCASGEINLGNDTTGKPICETKKDCSSSGGGRHIVRGEGGVKKQLCSNDDIHNAFNPEHKDYGVDCTPERAQRGGCSMDIYNILNIRQSDTETTPTEFVQDFVLTATTFVGTVLTFALVVSGLMIIFGGANENTASRGRQGIKYALIGYVIVLCSYAVIRLVQYLAAG